jgi:hypothetical protein
LSTCNPAAGSEVTEGAAMRDKLAGKTSGGNRAVTREPLGETP